MCLFSINFRKHNFWTVKRVNRNELRPIPKKENPIPKKENPDLIKITWLHDFIKQEKLNLPYSQVFVYKSNAPLYRIIFETSYKQLSQENDRDFISQTYRNLRKASTRETITIKINCTKKTIFINGVDLTSQFGDFFEPTFIKKITQNHNNKLQDDMLENVSELRQIFRELIRSEYARNNGWYDFPFWVDFFLNFLYTIQKKINDIFD